MLRPFRPFCPLYRPIHAPENLAAFAFLALILPSPPLLPSSLQFRPCAMVTPNFENIAEVNLAGEGFVESKVLAKKFTAMYLVCKELLSKQMHYDWGLRAMSVRGPYPALLLLMSNPRFCDCTLQ